MRIDAAGWSPRLLDLDNCSVAALEAAMGRPLSPNECPGAIDVMKGVPVYDCPALLGDMNDAAARRRWMQEWAAMFEHGPGILVLRGMFSDTVLLDRVTQCFRDMIEDERTTKSGGDHFGKRGANDRVWNALEKLCLREPELFAAYYGNPVLAAVCEAWLGPAYQITSQLNQVLPGGAAQTAHRDYHLGFMTSEQALEYPASAHRVSQFLTLQGAVAHVDMPVESGPTLYLPHSQKLLEGYAAVGLPAFQQYFAAHHVQLPLRKGDAVFFNPALMHAAGSNRTQDVLRLANLLQISSAFGRAMESVDRARMCHALYPVLLKAGENEGWSMPAAVAACGEGYAFPTNLDRDPPVGGLAPENQQALMLRALAERWPKTQFSAALQEHTTKRRTCDEA